MDHTQKDVESHDPENPERRAFALQSILAMLAGVTITISACGEDSSPTSPSPGDGRTGGVSANHGHSAVITGAQLMAANAVMLNIRGSATHPHTVELSPAEVAQIAAGQRVSKVSSSDDSPDAGVHNHVVTFN